MERPPSTRSLAVWWTAFAVWLRGSGDASVTGRLAGTVFAIRIVGAALAYLVQIVLARWMGSTDYGIYAYVWTWLVLFGSMLDLGMAISAQKFIPIYRRTGDLAMLRGFLFGGRWLTFAAASVAAVLLACAVRVLTPWIDPKAVVPFYLGCLALPAFVLASMQDGIARSHDWMTLALIPQFVVRHALVAGFAAGLIALGFNLDITAAMALSVAAIWIVASGQFVLLQRRIAALVEPGERRYAIGSWLSTALPIFLVETFYLLISNTDIVMLQIYRSSSEVGVYFAVAKTLALVSFVHYAIATTAAHRFSDFHASGDQDRLARYLTTAIRWTFWPSLAATVALLIVGKPLLWLFGPRFADGYDIMLVLSVGLLARAAVGPVERLLNMLGQQYLCAAVYAAAFAVNLVLCFALVPRFGGVGAAAATSVALVVESILLFWVTRRRLAIHAFAWGGPTVDAPPR